ncbi:MAG: DUF445 family protein, partial [Myxococcales bacterium]|nr:DUF445 family protein [Myxococcales bacterium]
MPQWLFLLLTVPTITGAIGWLTNWAAVKMIFGPERFIGVGKVGWQGILYHHADKFATNLGNLARDHLLSSDELVEKVDADELDKVLAGVLDAEAPKLVAEAAEKVRPGSWAMVPPPMQAMVVEQVKARTKVISRDVLAEVQGKATELLDLQQVVHGALTGPNVRRLARLTQEIGGKEFFFIEWSGGVFGFLVGLGQLGVWSLMHTWWLMPIVGALVGLGTNYLAIQMIFRPFEKTRYLGVFPYQGLFPKRQPEIASDYGRTTGAEVITAHNIINLLTSGERGAELRAAVEEAVSKRIDAEWQQVKGMVPLPVSDEQLAEVKQLVVTKMIEMAPQVRPQIEEYLDKQLDIRNTVETRLGSLSKPEFERLLRGVFQEDELTLIVVGGFLGA